MPASVTGSVQICLTPPLPAQASWHTLCSVAGSRHLSLPAGLHKKPSLFTPTCFTGVIFTQHSPPWHAGLQSFKYVFHSAHRKVFISCPVLTFGLFSCRSSPRCSVCRLHQTICCSTGLLCPVPFPPQRAERSWASLLSEVSSHVYYMHGPLEPLIPSFG